ncbi:hypothetical protein PM082_004697 [Marasmius tenuissimus]|nr:hypothetical protein PM082_004697 [Marasmius tenuissimus]
MNTHDGGSGTDGLQYPAESRTGAHDELAKKIGDDGYEWSGTFGGGRIWLRITFGLQKFGET